MTKERPEGAVRGPYRSGLRRRQLIIEQASAVFAERGYPGGSLRLIAGRVGASPASLIHHFGSKEGLLMAVLDDWETQTVKHTNAEHTGLAFFEHLGDLMRFHLAHPGLLELFLTLATEATLADHPARAFIEQRYAKIEELWASHLRQARQRGELRLDDAGIEREVRLLAAVADGLELQWLLDRRIDLVGTFEAYLTQAISRWTAPADGDQACAGST
ncbi:MAG: TetR/AcrR family transcriptional regulator [Propionicimonas sp.]